MATTIVIFITMSVTVSASSFIFISSYILSWIALDHANL
jgi:hypothetical protein